MSWCKDESCFLIEKIDIKMPKVSLLFIFVFTFVFTFSNARANKVSNEDMIDCVNALTKIDIISFDEAELLNGHFQDTEAGSFGYFWNKASVNTSVLKTFGDAVSAIRERHHLNTYERGLINIIFVFMSRMRNLVENGKIDTYALPDYIKGVVSLIDKLSPIEMFIYTRIIERAANQLEHNHEGNFKYSESDFEKLFDSLPYVLRSKAQKKYSMEQLTTSLNDLQGQHNGSHSDSYVEGLDHVDEMLKLGESLILRNIDPYETHIPEFADLINTHIDDIKKGIESQESYQTKTRMLRVLASFEREAQWRKKEGKVTYQWWLNFHLRLSVLITPREHRDENSFLGFEDIWKLLLNQQMDIAYLEALYRYPEQSNESNDSDTLFNSMDDLVLSINRFPRRIMIPTIHNLGIISMNRVARGGLHLVRLNNGPIVDIEGRLMYPDDLFISDIYYHGSDRVRDNESKVFRDHFQQKLNALTENEREAVEYIYFISNYKGYSFSDIIIGNNNVESTSLLYLISNRSSNDSARRFINRGKRAFIRVISDMSEEMGLIRGPLLGLSEKQMTRLYCFIADLFLKENLRRTISNE